MDGCARCHVPQRGTWVPAFARSTPRLRQKGSGGTTDIEATARGYPLSRERRKGRIPLHPALPPTRILSPVIPAYAGIQLCSGSFVKEGTTCREKSLGRRRVERPDEEPAHDPRELTAAWGNGTARWVEAVSGIVGDDQLGRHAGIQTMELRDERHAGSDAGEYADMVGADQRTRVLPDACDVHAETPGGQYSGGRKKPR